MVIVVIQTMVMIVVIMVTMIMKVIMVVRKIMEEIIETVMVDGDDRSSGGGIGYSWW